MGYAPSDVSPKYFPYLRCFLTPTSPSSSAVEFFRGYLRVIAGGVSVWEGNPRRLERVVEKSPLQGGTAGGDDVGHVPSPQPSHRRWGDLRILDAVQNGAHRQGTTVQEMVELMEKKYGKPKRIWVLDRGMVSEENIDFLRERGARYIVGTPKSQLKAFEAKLLEQEDWKEVKPGVEVKLVVHPDGSPEEQYVLCRSSARREKELAMLEGQRLRLRAQLDKTHASLVRRPAKEPGKIERRIGRWLGRFPAAERLLEVEVERDAKGRACGLKITERSERSAWAAHIHGAYLLRTNCTEQDPAKLWRWYIQLCQAEEDLPHQQERSEPAPPLSSKDRTGRSPHPGLLFEPRPLAHPGDVDARQRPGRLRPPVD